MWKSKKRIKKRKTSKQNPTLVWEKKKSQLEKKKKKFHGINKPHEISLSQQNQNGFGTFGGKGFGLFNMMSFAPSSTGSSPLSLFFNFPFQLGFLIFLLFFLKSQAWAIFHWIWMFWVITGREDLDFAFDDNSISAFFC